VNYQIKLQVIKEIYMVRSSCECKFISTDNPRLDAQAFEIRL